MISINLVKKKEKYKLPVVMGVDLNNVNWKNLILAWILLQVPALTVEKQWLEELSAKKVEVTEMRKKHAALRKRNRSNKQLSKMLTALNNRVEEIKAREKQVEKIVKIKTNPKKLLERLARDLPQEVWFDQLLIDRDKNIEVSGGTTVYKDVGVFIENTHQTPFFGKTLDLISSSTIEETVNNVDIRVEKFVIKGKVVTYDPYIGN